MKSFLLSISLVLLNSVSANAFDPGQFYPVELPQCPAPKHTLLEVVQFIPSHSADSRINNGQCQVKAPAYVWWDLINESMDPIEVLVDAGNCNPKDFEYADGKRLIKATLGYSLKVSMCGSNPGCQYSCSPEVTLWSL